MASNCPARKTVARRPSEKSFFPGRSAPIFPLISVLRCKSMRNRRRSVFSSLLERGTNVGQTIPWGVRLASSKVSFRKVIWWSVFQQIRFMGIETMTVITMLYRTVRLELGIGVYKFCEFLFNRLVHKLARFSLHIEYYLVTIAYHLCLILMSFDSSSFLFFMRSYILPFSVDSKAINCSKNMEVNRNFISYPFANLIKTRLKIVNEKFSNIHPARRISSQRIIKIFVPSNMV